MPGVGITPAQRALAGRIDAVLPQTQCTRCGYPDCASYALAIALSQAPINQCPPGGAQGIERIAQITEKPVQFLSADHGVEGPRALAVIDENWCIGCTLCIKACPTDAILGSNKLMHTVIAPWCTGCELCLPVCPVDCIEMVKVTGEKTGWAAWSLDAALVARERYTQRQIRLQQEDRIHQQEKMAEAEMKLADLEMHTKVPSGPTQEAALQRKRTIIEAALAKAKIRQSGS
jgi:electron transport complex protein RnfB